MSSQRHRHAIRTIRYDGHRLTKREREQLGLPREAIPRPQEPVPFPSDPSAYVWFALTTAPKREDDAARALSRAGFAAFNPTETVLVRQNRMVRHKRRVRERAILSSIVLVGVVGRMVERSLPARNLPDGQGGWRYVPESRRQVMIANVPWWDILALEHITGWVGIGGAPQPVPLASVVELHDLSGRRATTRNWSPAMGDAVEIATGAFEGKAGEVIELTNGKARVMLFGRDGVFAKLVKPLEVPETWLRERVA